MTEKTPDAFASGEKHFLDFYRFQCFFNFFHGCRVFGAMSYFPFFVFPYIEPVTHPNAEISSATIPNSIMAVDTSCLNEQISVVIDRINIKYPINSICVLLEYLRSRQI